MGIELILDNTKVSEDLSISFVVPSYHHSHLLYDAIDSIYSLKNIESISYELLVMINDPNEDVKDLVKRYGTNQNILIYFLII